MKFLHTSRSLYFLHAFTEFTVLFREFNFTELTPYPLNKDKFDFYVVEPMVTSRMETAGERDVNDQTVSLSI